MARDNFLFGDDASDGAGDDQQGPTLRYEDHGELPNWRDSATGDIPKVIVELSGDMPVWLDPDPPKVIDNPRGAPKGIASEAARREYQPQERSRVLPKKKSRGARRTTDSRGEDGTTQSGEGSLPNADATKSPKGQRMFSAGRSTTSRVRRSPGIGSSKVETAKVGRRSRGVREAQAKEQAARTMTVTRETSGRSKSQSTVTGLALGLLVLGGFYLGAHGALVLVFLAVVIAAIEYYAAVQKAGMAPAKVVGLVAVIFCIAGAYGRGFTGLSYALTIGTIATLLWYLSGSARGTAFEGLSATLVGIVWIGFLGSFAALIIQPSSFHGHGVRLLLATIITCAASDTFAYFGGAAFGRHKLAPNISPSKTLEGLIIGAVSAIAVGVLIAGHIHPLTLRTGLELGIVAAIVTPLGDLCESMIKRNLAVKDTSHLLPGHGGLLDRIDGILFMLPMSYFLFRLLNLG